MSAPYPEIPDDVTIADVDEALAHLSLMVRDRRHQDYADQLLDLRLALTCQ